MTSKYYTLLCRYEIDGLWHVEFGDFDKESVEFERETLRDDGVQAKNLKIITTKAKDDHAHAVHTAVEKLNA